MRVQTAPRGIGVFLGLDATFHPLMGFPGYHTVAHLPLADRVAALRQPALRARILAEDPVPMAGDGSPIPPLADKLLALLDWIVFRMYRLADPPDYEPDPETSIGVAAVNAGVPPLAALYDALLEDDGRALIYFPIYNYMGGNLDEVREMLTHPLALPGLSDGGAHVGTVCDASFPTWLLTHWARDRSHGQIPVERVVQMLCADTSAHLGLRDRGRLLPGLKADINVIDHQALRLCTPQMVTDLPGGGRRLLQDAVGYRATIVAGQIIAADGRLTGARPGRLVRGGRA